MIELPEPIRRYFDGSNAHDPDACAACFTDDAIVRDERHEHRGLGAVREWMRDAFTRYEHTVEVLSSAEAGDGVIVTGRVSGNFPGSPIVLRHSFVIAGGKIARLEIVP